MKHPDIYPQNAGNQPGETVRVYIRVENPLEKGIIGQWQGLLPLAEIQKSPLPFGIQTLVASVKKRGIFNN